MGTVVDEQHSTGGQYYNRRPSVNTDGTLLFANQEDNAGQSEIALMIERCYGPGLKLKPFGRLCVIDYYAERDGRMCALLEIKRRSHESTKHDTVFLNVRKWLALTIGSVGLGVPSFFVAGFADRVMIVDVASIEATRHMIGGTLRVVKSHSDVEPIIEVPIEIMRELITHG